ncbi:MAG TPA: penicillin-binding protein activator [Candidatus Paceibacterota bacterium]
MNKPSKTLVTVIVLILLILVWFVSHETKKTTSATPMNIGVIAPLTGAFADYGENVKAGVVAGLVASVGTSTSVGVTYADDACDAKQAVSAYHKLINVDQVKFIIGPGCGSPQEAIVPLLSEDDVVVMVPSAASADLSKQSGGNFFNIQYSLEDESKFNAEQIYAMGYKNVAVITYANAFSKAHDDSFHANFKGTIVSDQVIQDDNADILPYITKIKAAKPDAIYAPDIAFFFAGATAKLKQLGMSKTPIFTTYVAELPSALPLVEGAMYSFPSDLATGTTTKGAVYELSRQATEMLVPIVISCGAEPLCVKGKLSSTGKFDGNGVYKRQLILKQVVKGEPTVLEMDQNKNN